MAKLGFFVLVAALAVALADNRVQQRGLIHHIKKGVAGPNPYIFLTVPKGRSQSVVQGFEVIEENQNRKTKSPLYEDNDDEEEFDYDDDNIPQHNNGADDDDDDDNDEQQLHVLEVNEANLVDEEDDDEDEDVTDESDKIMNANLKLRRSGNQVKNAKATQVMVSRPNTGAIMVPDEIIEIEGQSVYDEKTGKAALLLPRSVLDSIPDGTVVAVMERSVRDESEGRANRVIVRRRRKGVRRNIRRRTGGNKRIRVVQYGVNKRRNNFNRPNFNVVRRGNKRRGNRRRLNRQRINLRV